MVKPARGRARSGRRRRGRGGDLQARDHGEGQEGHGLEGRGELAPERACCCQTPLRRAISARNPDILKSGGGGANAILVRGLILDHRALRLRRAPEGRWVHGVRLQEGAWAVNVHSQNHPEALALADTRKAIDAAREWAAGAPLVFGGDINLKRPPEFPGLVHVGGNHVDHLFTDGRPAAGRHEVIERGPLSDHPPVAVTLA